MTGAEAHYPVNLEIDYPVESDRLTTFFRFLTVIPILLLLGMLMGGELNTHSAEGWRYAYHGAGFVFLPTVLLIVIRKKYPKWWFDWNLALINFSMRVFSYLILLTHTYPSTDEPQSVHIDISYPDVEKELGRGMPLVKWLLAIPHVIVLYLLAIAAAVCTFIAWFAILLTGEYPKALFDFVVGVLRWSLRVFAYAILLTTDEYPPFQLYDRPPSANPGL
jgi:hypothetical protein